MLNPIKRLFSTQYMVKESLKMGELPSNREAYKTSINMALPSVAEMVSIAIIGMADTIMVSRLGSYAIAAVGLTGQPRMIFISIFFALNIGVTAIISRRKGEDNQADARLCLRQALMVNVGLSVLMSILSVVLAKPIMLLAGANAETLDASIQYFQILGAGLILQTLSMTICAAQRGIGKTRITMVVNIAANIFNVVFNFLLIEGNFGFPRLEMRGAAIATLVGNAVGLIMAIRSITRNDAYLFVSHKDSWKPDPVMLKNIANVGGNSIVEQIALRAGFFIYARVIAGLGTSEFAAHQIAMQLMNLSFTFADGIGAATTSLVGQNLGRKRPDISIMYGNIGQRLAFVVSIGLFMLSIFGRNVFPTFFSDDPHIIESASRLLIILAIIQPIQTSQLVMGGALRGAADTRFVAITMLITVAIIRPLTAYILVYPLGLGLIGAWLAIICDQSARLIMLIKRFTGGKWINIEV